MWLYLSIAAGVALVVFWGGRNPVWGAATIGFILGIIAASVYYFMGEGFKWSTVGRWVVVLVLVAAVQELVRKIIIKNKQN